ncbi:MAG TPA: DUF721 domain-containing protein [Sedimentisphaerales bacterium]|nr:DUF721 domain-containing protein [Sedimentisphaerales bacterium]
MDDNERLRSYGKVGFKRPRGPEKAAKLGDAVRQLMDHWVSPRQARFEAVTDLWNQLLPAELSRHCRVADISGGQLKVLADAPAYMHELRLCSSDLLEQLQQRCPKSRIKGIKCAIG